MPGARRPPAGVLVHGPQPVTPVLVAYDDGWPARFAAHRERIVAALGERARVVEHIGSTAVPGLAAKDVVDVLVGIDLRPREHGSAL